jgi:hypothetical protein
MHRAIDPNDVGRLVGEAPFVPVPGEPLIYRCDWGEGQPADILVMVTFEGQYPFERHCRYALHRDPASRYTFSNMEFRDGQPGIRVGPWPGWRGIPEMPPARLYRGPKAVSLQYQFWGDELVRRHVRAIAMLPLGGGEIRVATGDPRLKPTRAEFVAVVPCEVTPVPFELPAGLSSLHPRLLLSGKDLAGLRDTSRPGRARSLERIHELVRNWNEPLKKDSESKIAAGREGLSDEDRVLIGAFVALLEGGEENRARSVRAFLDYVDLAGKKDFAPLSIDTQAGEVLFVLCLGYDWLYEMLSEQEREVARRRIFEVAETCWAHLGYARRDFAQAHFLGCGLGLLAFSLLFWTEHPRSKEWAAYLHGVVRWVLSALPPDGYYPHGINLWIYEFGFLVRWLEIFRSAAGIDLWKEYVVLGPASKFRGAATSPGGLHGVTMGDPQYRVGGDSWIHFLIASRTGSGEAQWLGELLRELPSTGVDFRNAPARRRVYEHLWYQDTITAVTGREQVLAFVDGAQIFVRTEKSLFTFRCGPPLGEHRYRSGITGGYGHSDPCNGSFLYVDSGLFAVSGPGPLYRRDSLLHNIVTIEGQGQLGDSAVWHPDFVPRKHIPPKPAWRAEGRRLGLSADLTASYLPHLGVKLMRRTLLIEPDRFIAGADDIRLSQRRSIEWNLHSWGEFHHEVRSGVLSFVVSAEDRRLLRIYALFPQGAEWKTGESKFIPAYPHDGRRDRFLQLSTRQAEARMLWCLLLSDEDPPEVLASDMFLRFADGTRVMNDGSRLTATGDS